VRVRDLPAGGEDLVHRALVDVRVDGVVPLAVVAGVHLQDGVLVVLAARLSAEAVLVRLAHEVLHLTGTVGLQGIVGGLVVELGNELLASGDGQGGVVGRAVVDHVVAAPYRLHGKVRVVRCAVCIIVHFLDDALCENVNSYAIAVVCEALQRRLTSVTLVANMKSSLQDAHIQGVSFD
jgi:hypothetical protein